MKKQDVLILVEKMPDEFDVEDLMYHLYVLAKIEKAQRSIEEHGLISEEEVDREIENWFALAAQPARVKNCGRSAGILD